MKPWQEFIGQTIDGIALTERMLGMAIERRELKHFRKCKPFLTSEAYIREWIARSCDESLNPAKDEPEPVPVAKPVKRKGGNRAKTLEERRPAIF